LVCSLGGGLEAHLLGLGAGGSKILQSVFASTAFLKASVCPLSGRGTLLCVLQL
jgi:hypothetical protein